MRGASGLLAALAALLLAACGGVKHHQADAYPERLSAWGVIERSGDRMQIAEGVMPYEVNSPLFSDYALKYRTLYLPPGTSATYETFEALDFPVGTIVTKTFFYSKADDGDGYRKAVRWHGDLTALDLSGYDVLETRMLVRQADGWDALPYVWQGDDAYLDLTGELLRVSLDGEAFAYAVPSRNECGGCHVTNHSTGAFQPIGLRARHMPEPTLRAMAANGQLTGLPAAVTQNVDIDHEDLDRAARSYLDINCGHCHNAHGAADTSGLLLDYAELQPQQYGVCKPPIAVGRGSGDRRFGIVPGHPDASILPYRMQTNDPGQRMPEVGRAIAHEEGIALIRRWIVSLQGDC